MKEACGVIFDLDGTLLDTLADLVNGVNHILKKYNCPVRTAKEIRWFLGYGSRVLMQRSLPENFDKDRFEEVFEEFKTYYRENSQIETKPYDGILEMMDKLNAQNVKLAVVSNKPDPAAVLLCREYFGDRLCFSLGDREGVSRKPSKEPVELAIKSMGITKAVYVGDSEVDIETAQNAEIPSVSVTWGFRDRDYLEEQGAEHLADDAEELYASLVTLLGIE